MKTVGFWRAAWLVARKDLQLEWRTFDALAASVVFAVVVLLVFQFAVGGGPARQLSADALVPGVLWLAISFSSVVGIARSMDVERRGDTLAGLFRAPIDRGAIYAGKLIANAVRIALLEVILVPLAIVFFNASLGGAWLELIFVLALCSFGLCALGTLFGAIVSRVGRGEALLSTLLLPASTPLLLAGVTATGALFRGDGLASVSRWLGMAAGFGLLYFFVALATFEYVLEE
ncbi:MAG: ABC transporter permease [Acidobacteria bacterium]|nr:ABC transporter permease [Acidobacteriota bacterium]NIM63956.1 ABC transporter permease [Acidobacteriota bacterium]NIO59361.1 ABC transporter permease [Acidobacteriota bacterium]NIQ30397.1 ABC transporter permease [Acidobacteriota bacterium]NIQ85323.1 ABC transporter permease [Acidobacteriota bacterium]